MKFILIIYFEQQVRRLILLATRKEVWNEDKSEPFNEQATFIFRPRVMHEKSWNLFVRNGCCDWCTD